MPKILVVRRDNIGDLVCTTPLLTALRRRFPSAWIGALVNSYNAAVLDGNPDVSEVFAYQKLKHRGSGEPLLGNILARYRLVRELRRRSLDHVVLAGNSSRAIGLARWLRAGRIVGHDAGGARPDNPVQAGEGAAAHEVELTFRLARAFDIEGLPPAPAVYPEPRRRERLRRELAARLPQAKTWTALHISARKPSQRWPLDRYAQLARDLARVGDAGMLLFWSPGAGSDPRHPGDDEQAAALAAELRGLPIVPVPTRAIAELIAGLALCDRVVCSDGGAMHLAAALGKPIVCLFGQSDAARWHPWGTPYELLQLASRDARDIGVADVLDALARLPQPSERGRA